MKTILLSVAAITALTGSMTSAADPVPQDVHRASVAYSDLNLGTPAGAATLYARLQSASRKVCPLPDYQEAGAAVEARKCRTLALDRAMNDIGSSTLTALHRSGESPIDLASSSNTRSR